MSKMGLICYRIENNSGIGPFRGGDLFASVPGPLWDKLKTPRTADMFMEMIYAFTQEGFDKLVKHWSVRAEWERRAFSKGFRCYMIEVEEYDDWEDPMQIRFQRCEIIDIIDITEDIK